MEMLKSSKINSKKKSMKICLNSQNKKPKQETLNTKNLNKNWTNAKMFMMQIL